MIVAGEPVARFISREIGMGLCPPYSTMGIERDGKIVAGALFNQFEGADIHVTVAGKGWTRAFIRNVGTYVFDQLKCDRMTATTEQPKVAAYAVRLGGQIEGCMRNHFGEGRDGIIIGILKDEWIFGNVGQSSAADELHALPDKGSAVENPRRP